MTRRSGSTPLELDPEDSVEFRALCDERRFKRVQLGSILLRYAMRRVDDAIAEWQQEGQRKTQRRRSGPTPLRPSASKPK